MDVLIGGNVPHNGGHCQFALSYDKGLHWLVFYTIIHSCLNSTTGPVEFSYKIPIPGSAPKGKKVVFSWSWINATGGREFYMNCVDIEITSPSSASPNEESGLTGVELLVVNLPGYPLINEFIRPSQNDGKALLERRKHITVFGNGTVVHMKYLDESMYF